MMGVQPSLDRINVKPCLPERYRDAEVELDIGKTRARIVYKGFGSEVVSATLNGESVACADGYVSLDKAKIYAYDKVEIVIFLK